MSDKLVLSPSIYVPPIKARWLTTKEAAQYVKIQPRTLLMWVREGKIKAYSLSGTRRHVWRFLQKDLDALITARMALPFTPAEQNA